MAVDSSPFTCDAPMCDARRAEANHWFLVFRYMFHGPGETDAFPMTGVMPWVEKIARSGGMKHACGLAHAQVILSKMLEKAP